MRKILFTTIVILLISFFTMAQDVKYEIDDSDYSNNQIEMADGMRSNGKIYVVVAVILVVFAGLGFYMYSTDRKLSALEKELTEHKTK